MWKPVEIEDTQTLAFNGHGDLPFGKATWLSVTNPAQARDALRLVITNHVSFGKLPSTKAPRAQLLLSASGLRALEVPKDELFALDRAFQEGIVTAKRSRTLGDAGRNDPKRWMWNDRDTDAVVLVYADASEETELASQRIAEEVASGWDIRYDLAIRIGDDNREFFGFRDGITRTRIDLGDGSVAAVHDDVLPAGEVLLGYSSATGEEVTVPPLGRNGSFVVMRQLKQDVRAFWRFWLKVAGESEEEAIWLASKAIGRWPNGMPISGETPSPEPLLDEAVLSEGLSFRGDPLGDRCPLGSHIRRANPRDALVMDPQISRSIVALHRIIRRGRVYGSPAPADWYPTALGLPKATVGDPRIEAERGLLFLCLCGDLSRQFEFIQQSWLNHPKFGELYDEVDPIAGGDGIYGAGRHFSIPRNSVRRRIQDVAGWVTVRGGGYFLMPGRQAMLGFL